MNGTDDAIMERTMKELPAWVSDWWQPIETAPMDGEVVLLYKPDEQRSGDYIAAGYWGDWPAQGRDGQCWIACSGGPLAPPTHWMPRPNPPH